MERVILPGCTDLVDLSVCMYRVYKRLAVSACQDLEREVEVVR